MSHRSFPVLTARRGATALLTAATTFLLLADAGSASATITARLNGAKPAAAPQMARQPPRVLDADAVRDGLRHRQQQSDEARQRTLNARRVERPAAPGLPLPRHFDPNRWSNR